MFKFNGREYEIVEAILDAYVTGDELIWGFDLRANSKLETDGNFPEEVHVSIHTCPAFSSKKGELLTWLDVAGKEIILQDDYDHLEPDILVYINEHTPLLSGGFRISNIDDQIILDLKGITNYDLGDNFKL